MPTAQEVYERLPGFVTFADIQRAGGPRATAMRRWLRDNVQAYMDRRQRSLVMDKSKDKDLIMTLLSRVGSGQSGGLVAPNRAENDAVLAGLGSVVTPASAASIQGNAHGESPGEKAARLQAAQDDKRQQPASATHQQAEQDAKRQQGSH